MADTDTGKPIPGAPIVPSPDKVLKGDAGTAGTTRSPGSEKSAIQEALEAVQESERAQKIGTDEDMAGRIIPMGEPAENPLFQAIAKYFDIQERDFKDASHDLGFIIEYLSEGLGVKGIQEIDKVFTFLRALEDRLVPPQEFETRRYQRVYNYLILKEKSDAMNRALKALERSRYGGETE